MSTTPVDWAFLGIPGWRELALVAVVTLVLYGRSGLLRGSPVRVLRPWLSPVRRGARPGPAPGDRLFWALALTAMTAVAAWIVTRTLILGAPGLPR